MQQSRSITLMMFQYANDHSGKYPDGKSSTEVFQKLLDGNYASDPTIFYDLLPGKTKPVPGQPLKPENVSWDVTNSLDASDPDQIPAVFMTGFKVTYAPGAAIVPFIKPYPKFGPPPPSSTWLFGESDPGLPGIAVTYKGNYGKWLPATGNSVPNFIDSSTVFPPGKKYIQLTPDGPLP